MSPNDATPLFQAPKKTVLAIKSQDGKVIKPVYTGPPLGNPINRAGLIGKAHVRTDIKANANVNDQARQILYSASPHAAIPQSSTKPAALSGADAVALTALAKQSRLNVYAPIHVPDWLLAINESYATPVDCVQLPHFDAQQYASKIGADAHIEPAHSSPIINQVTAAACDGADNPPSLEQDNYGPIFVSLLNAEAQALRGQLSHYSLYQSPLIKDASTLLYRLHVPGLRENLPRVEIGDIVLVRPLSTTNSSRLAEANIVWRQYLQHQHTPHPAFTGFEYHAVVWRVHRPSETIFLQINDQQHSQTPLPQIANITFVLQTHNINSLLRAISRTHNGLGESHLLRSMLFPNEKSDAVMQTQLSSGKFDIDWKDGQLNFEQKKAVAAIVENRYGAVPYLISGPPGTGKTRTIVETALQLLSSSNTSKKGVGSTAKPHLLICAPSDAAADTIALRLSSYLTKEEMFRLNGWTRTYAEVPDKLMLYSHSTENDTFGLPDFHKLMSYSVVVTTCRDANVLIEARLTNKDLAQLALNTLKAVSPLAAESLTSALLHWTALLLDEAAQASEPESLIPLSVILPLDFSSGVKKAYPQFVLAGDEFQLGPRVVSESPSQAQKASSVGTRTGGANLSTSLFQRLFNRPFYANHPLSRANGLRPLTRELLPLARPAFANLIRNYRSHSAILSVPSSLFYHDTLIPEVAETRASTGTTTATGHKVVSAWPGWTKPNWPVLFVQNNGPDEVDDILVGDGTGAGSLYNNSEIEIMIGVVHSLLRSQQTRIADLKAEQIVVMSPFRAQVVRIRKRLREIGLAAVDVGPLEAFQGLEARVVILCTTRTRRGLPISNALGASGSVGAGHFVRQDQERGLGIIDEPKRFNVAITRAKEGLIVIGDAATLTVTGDRCWRAFLAFCARNRLVRGIDPSTDIDIDILTDSINDILGNSNGNGNGNGLDDDLPPPGRLERILRQRDHHHHRHHHHDHEQGDDPDRNQNQPPRQDRRVIGLRGFVEDGEEQGELVVFEEEEAEEEEEEEEEEEQDEEEECHGYDNGDGIGDGYEYFDLHDTDPGVYIGSASASASGSQVN